MPVMVLEDNWFRERVEDRGGTPDGHPFWDDVEVTRNGPWRLFGRDGAWYGYNTETHAWALFPG